MSKPKNRSGSIDLDFPEDMAAGTRPTSSIEAHIRFISTSESFTPDCRGYVVDMTPALAEQILVRDSYQTNINPQLVATYSRDMLGNRWRSNMFPIAFTYAGGLMDGQHRLTAIVQTGVTIRGMAVIFGERSLAPTFNGGRRNTTSDAIRLATGVAPNKTVAAGIKLEARDFKPSGRPLTRDEEYALVTSCANVDMLTSLANRSSNFLTSVQLGTAVRCAKRRPLETAEFFGQIARKDRLVRGVYSTAANMLLNHLEESKRGRRVGTAQEKIHEDVFKGITAFNRWLEGRELVSFRYNKTLPIPEVK